MGQVESMIDILEEFGEPKDASDWLIALREQPDDLVLQQKFESWLLSHPENVAAWQEVNRLGAMLVNAQQGRRLDHDRASDQNAPQYQEARARQSTRHKGVFGRAIRSHRYVVALSGLAALLLVVIIGGMQETGAGNFYETETAETRTVTLQDETRIDLAPDSQIEVAYADDVRQVTLLAGRAYFDVTPNKDVPFIVNARNLSVRVLGTAFEVSTDANTDAVSVAEGRVEVTDQDTAQRANLTIGDQVVLTAANEWKKGTVPLEAISAWRRGMIVAHKDRLGDLVAQISDYYPGYVFVHGDHLADMEISGVFDVSKPERALDIIGQSHGVQVRHVTPWVTILSEN